MYNYLHLHLPSTQLSFPHTKIFGEQELLGCDQCFFICVDLNQLKTHMSVHKAERKTYQNLIILFLKTRIVLTINFNISLKKKIMKY